MRVGFHAPDTVEELAYLVAEAADTRTPLEVMGRGTKREVGRPVQYGAVLSTENLTGIQLYEPSELVLVARAGTPIAQIEQALTEHDQEMPFEPIDLGPVLGFGRGQGTVGGMVATNFSGSRRVLSGSVRDHVLGVQAVNGSGETIRAGGRVMKNVTGYDLSRALSGSWGTLAVMTEVAIMVLPAQREVRTVLSFGLADPNGIEALCLAVGTPFEVSGTVHMHAELAERLSDQEIAQRKENQQDRIAQGIKSGQLTAGEASNLERKEAGINREVRNDRAANGGKLTSAERRQVNRQKDRTSHAIYRKKHNDRVQ